jgi:hypothetical protein
MATEQELEQLQQRKDELQQRDRRIAELKNEIDELRERNQALRQNTQEWAEQFESWKEAFQMVQNDSGVWEWNADYTNGEEWKDKYVEILRDWNKRVGEYNSLVRVMFAESTLRDRGRPIAATAEQRAIVFESHAEGRSLRECADDAKVGLQTVRTLLGKIDGTDRTSRRLTKYRKKEMDRLRLASWKARKRTRDALPKRLHEQAKKTSELLKQVEGRDRPGR